MNQSLGKQTVNKKPPHQLERVFCISASSDLALKCCHLKV